MGKLTVFRFHYFDRARGAWIQAPDLATEKAIADVGGSPEAGSAQEIDPGRVSMSGLVIRDSPVG